MKLYHFTNKIENTGQNTVTIVPKRNPNGWSRNDYEAWSRPRSFFYTNLVDAESFFNGCKDVLVAEVDDSKILDLNTIDLSCFSGVYQVDFEKLARWAESEGYIGFVYGGKHVCRTVVIWDREEAGGDTFIEAKWQDRETAKKQNRIDLLRAEGCHSAPPKGF